MATYQYPVWRNCLKYWTDSSIITKLRIICSSVVPVKAFLSHFVIFMELLYSVCFNIEGHGTTWTVNCMYTVCRRVCSEKWHQNNLPMMLKRIFQQKHLKYWRIKTNPSYWRKHSDKFTLKHRSQGCTLNICIPQNTYN